MTPNLIQKTGDTTKLSSGVAGIDRTFTNDSLDSVIVGPEVIL